MANYAYQSDKLYCELVHLVLNSEGGYVNDPHDPGGPTKYGIALNFNRAALAEFGIHEAVGVRTMAVEQALQIYYVKYWLAAGCDHIPDKRLVYVHFDAAVNHGVGAAAKFCFALSHKPSGFEAGNGKNESLWLRLYLEYLNARMRSYTHDKNRAHYLEGWINRLISISTTALSF